jgi:hypothetical protein
MSKYQQLDEQILSYIGELPVTFMEIHFADGIGEGIHAECERYSSKIGKGFRVLDRRLQALRKAGKIRAIPGKGWVRT